MRYTGPFLRAAVKQMVDPWHSNNRTRTEQQDFKEALIEYYERGVPGSTLIRCMILDRPLPSQIVRASHLWKRSTLGVGLQLLGLDDEDVHNMRNGILVHEQIEMGFDKKDLCFVYNPLTQSTLCKVLSPALLNEVCLSST